MLTNLEWLNKGEAFPPASEVDRLRTYRENKLIFEGEHHEVYREQLKRIERVVGNFGEVINFGVIFNFQKLMTLKIADMLWGDPPDIQSEDQDAIEWINYWSDLDNVGYECAIDVSRYGTGLFYIRPENGHGVIDLTQPEYWYPIVDPDNVKIVTNHVIAWQYEVKVRNETSKYLKVIIHNKGSYETRLYECDSVIGNLLESEITETGLNDFAIVPVHNVMTSDRTYGMDDYKDIDSIVSEIMVRVGQISKILDKHASPSMQGPASVLEMGTNGEYQVKAGNYFTIEDGDKEVSYLTWNGQLEANFKQLEKLTNILYTISEMGSALVGDLTTSTGNVASGSALRRLMVSPLAKVNRIKMRFDYALKKAIDLCSQYGGVKSLVDKEISITWRDGLPSDPVEDADIIKTRIESGTMSVRRALIQFDGMSEEDADEEIAVMMEESRMSSPVQILESTDTFEEVDDDAG